MEVFLTQNHGYSNPGGGGTPYNGLYGEAPPERGTFFRLQVYKRVGISQVEVYERVAIFVRVLLKKGLALKQIKQTQLMTVSF